MISIIYSFQEELETIEKMKEKKEFEFKRQFKTPKKVSKLKKKNTNFSQHAHITKSFLERELELCVVNISTNF